MQAESIDRETLLRSAPLDHWVALSQDGSRVVAVGRNYIEAAEKSDAIGEHDPILLKTPSSWAPLFV